MAEIIDMPKLSDTMTVGTLVKWLKQVGDTVASGDIVAEVETDKATMEVENFFDWRGVKALCQRRWAGAHQHSHLCHWRSGGGAPCCRAAAETPASSADPGKSEAATQPNTASSAPTTAAPQAAVTPAATTDPHERLKSSPLARKLAAEKGILLHALQGSGPSGRIVKKDVLQAAASGVPATAGASFIPARTATLETKSIPLSGMRRTIAKRLIESKTQIPHFYLDIEVDVAPLLKLRAELNNHLADLPPEQGGLKLTVNDFILKASTVALCKVPAVNASWMGETIQQHGNVHMAFGVAIDDGLVTPVIRNAESKNLLQFSSEAKALIGKARNKKLTPDEMTGSTFTVTNLGMYGITGFSGIINPPNAAILAVGSSLKKPVIDANDNIVVGQRMTLGMSCDHRVIDGATGAEYLAALKQVLETPALMLLG